MLSLVHHTVGVLRTQGRVHSQAKIFCVGLKTLAIPPDYSNVVLPAKPKLKVLNKVPNLKKAVKTSKKLSDIQGPATTGNTFTDGSYAIVALGGGYIRWGHIEMMRLTLNRKMDLRTTFAHWRINAPYKPVTKKSLGQRMGGGKGAIERYVTPVRAGRLVLEVGGRVELGEVEPVLKQIAKKLPFPAQVVSRESLAALQAEQKERKENNQNPWTFQQLVRGNMLGCRKVLSAFDLHNNGRYTGRFYFPDRV